MTTQPAPGSLPGPAAMHRNSAVSTTDRTGHATTRTAPQRPVIAGQRPARICLLGNFGSPNLGNEGTLTAMLDALRRQCPDAELLCACWPPDSLEAQHGIAGTSLEAPPFRSRAVQIVNRLTRNSLVRAANLAHAYRTIRRHDIVVVPGTGILDDFGENWRGMPLMIFTWALAARLARRPFWFLSIGAGPIRHTTSRWLMLTAARLARYRSYRDEVSKTYMQGIGLDTSHDPVVPDLAFALPMPSASPHVADDRRLRVGLGIMAYHGWFGHLPEAGQIYDTYISNMAQFAAWLIGKGHSVRMLIGETFDAAAIADVVARLPDDVRSRALDQGALVIEPAASLADIKQQMTDTDVVVTTRYHNVVCAFSVGKPVISISYAAKNDELLAAAGLDPFCQHIESLDVARLIAQFEQIVGARALYAGQVEKAVSGFRSRLAEQESKLASALAQRT